MECEEVMALVSGETKHCRELPPFLVSYLFPRMGERGEALMAKWMSKRMRTV